MKRLLSNLSVINVLLLLSIVLFGCYGYYQTKHSLSALSMNLPDTKQDTTSTKADDSRSDEEDKSKQPTPPQTVDYTIIAEKNLFHPERRIPPEKKAVVELPRPEFLLYGTLLSGDSSIAYLEDLKAPQTTPGRGKRQKALKIGQIMSGFTLKEIYEDRVVFVKDQERIEVRVLDNQAKKTRHLAPPADKTQDKKVNPTVRR